MLANPEYREAMKRQQRLMLPRMYPDLQAALHLDEQQADRFYDVLAEQQMDMMTQMRPPFTPGGQPDQNAIHEWQERQQQQQKKIETAIVGVLGQDGLQQWKDYQTSMPARSQVRELRSTLESAGLSLRQDQAEQLVTAITAEQQRTVNEMRTAYVNNQGSARFNGLQMLASSGYSEQALEAQKQQQQNLRTAVAPILTSQQMRYLERMHASQIEMLEVGMKMNRATQAEMEALNGRNGAPSNSVATGVITEP